MLAMLFVAFAMGATAQDDNVTVVLDENFDSFTEGSEDEPALRIFPLIAVVSSVRTLLAGAAARFTRLEEN